jgi:hypothetical protein
MTALYVIANEYRAAADKLADLDLPPEVIADTLESLSGDVEVKATNVAAFARNLEATAAAIKDAEAQMAARRKALEGRAESLRRYLLSCMQATGISKIESPHFALAVKQNPPSVVLDEPGLIPEGYWRQKPPPAPEPDKVAIKEALARGLDVPGAHLERGYRLEIR